MAGYGGQLVALDVATPSESELAAAQASSAQTQSELAREMAPYQVAGAREQAKSMELTNASNQLTLQQQIQLNSFKQHMLRQQAAASTGAASSPLATSGAAPPGASPLASTAGVGSTSPAPAAAPEQPPLFDPQIQQAMQSIDPDDPDASKKWDEQMLSLADEVPQAGQFIGQYSKANVNNWRSQIGSHAYQAAKAQSPLAAGSPASPLGAPTAGPTAPPASPLTGQPDPDLQAMSVLDPKGTQELMQMQGMMRYQQTGDPEVLKRYAPALYKDLVTAQKDMTEAQKTAVATRTSQMGQSANAVLALAHQLGPDAPEVRAAYNDAIVDAARNNWIPAAQAKAAIAAPIDFGHLSYLATTSQTVSEYMRTSGQEARNVAAATPQLERIETVDPVTGTKTTSFVPLNRMGQVMGGGGAGGTGTGGAMPTALPDIVSRIATVEGTGQNPKSSAAGIGQFTNGTWLSTYKAANPNSGLSDAQILAQRSNPAVATQMLTHLIQSNANTLQSAGVPPTADNIYLAHFLGPTGAVRALKADPSTPIAQVTTPQQVAANPETLGKFQNVGQLREWAAGKMATGSTAGGASAPGVPGAGSSFVTAPGIGELIPAGLTGQDAFKALPPAMQPRVQQLLDGRSMLSAREKSTPQGQALLQAANQIDPLYDEASAPARVKAFQQFTGNGKAAQVAASGNRLAYHANDLYKASQALGGPDLGFSPLSNAVNGVQRAFQQKQVGAYNAILPFISGELQKLTKNGSSTEGETKLIMANLAASQPEDVRMAAIEKVASLAEGQFKPFRDQYQSVFGADKAPPVNFTPLTEKIFSNIQAGGAPLNISPTGNEVPAAAIAHLHANPALASAFDAKYGPNAARVFLGGQ